MEKATMILIISNVPGVDVADNNIMIPQEHREDVVNMIANALEMENDIQIDDIEGDTILVPFMTLFNAKRIQFTDIERDDQ